jgi:hypothetical protein
VAIDDGIRTAMGNALKAGLDTLDLDQEIVFTLYNRLVLPADGFVFWIKAATVNMGAVLGKGGPLNTFALNQAASVTVPAPTKTIMGAVHYITDLHQTLDENYATNRVIFSAEDPIQDFNVISPNQLYIGAFDGIRFAFSARGSYFQQSNLHHYVGQAINADMESQIIDDPSGFDVDALIVSNSLPAFLAINRYAPLYPVLIPFPSITLYPSFLSGLNLRPPFGTVHIEPDSTVALQMAPAFDDTMSSLQLAQDRVTITLYGATNRMAQDFLAALYQYTLDTELFGIAGVMGVIRDDKKFQTEMLVLAERKHIILDVSYNQFAMRQIARQLITEAFAKVYAQDTFLEQVPIPVP